MEFDEDVARQIMFDGMWDAECPECGYSSTIEPDADYLCPDCRIGRLTSPLRLWGLI